MIKLLFIIILVILANANQQAQQRQQSMTMKENKFLLHQFGEQHQPILNKKINWDARVYRNELIRRNRQKIKNINKKSEGKYLFAQNSFIVYSQDEFSRIYLNTITNDPRIMAVEFSKIIQHSPQTDYQPQWKVTQQIHPTFTIYARMKNKIDFQSQNDGIQTIPKLSFPDQPKSKLALNQNIKNRENKILAFVRHLMFKNGRSNKQIQAIIDRYKFRVNYSDHLEFTPQIKQKISSQNYQSLVHQEMKNIPFYSNFSNNRTHRLFFLQQASEIMTFKEVYQYAQNVDWTCLSGEVRFTKFCGSSYVTAVADSIAAMLGIYFFGYHIYLSGQDILDCASNSLVFGCQAGYIEGSFLYAVRKGLRDGYNYPLSVTSVRQVPEKDCFDIQNQRPKFSIKTFKSTSSPKDCRKLLIALQSQPVVVGIDGRPIIFYKKGSYQCSMNINTVINHSVLVVGFRKTKGYKIKNSWGTQWGEQGYMWLKVNKVCTICNLGYYPVPKSNEGYQLYSQNEVYASCPDP